MGPSLLVLSSNAIVSKGINKKKYSFSILTASF